MTSSDWAIKQLSNLLPLDHDSLSQILSYTSTLPKPESAEHLKNLLGDTPKALEFISSYNARREDVAASAPPTIASPIHGAQSQNDAQSVPRSGRKGTKKKEPLHQLPSRQIEGQGDVSGGYRKDQVGDYASGGGKPRRPHQPAADQASAFALSSTPVAKQLPKTSVGAVGNLLSDLPNVRSKTGGSSRGGSRTASPAPTKVMVQGGVAGKGASTTLEDLDSAIRTLELSLFPTTTSTSSTSSSSKKEEDRKCNCNATRHPLLLASPNCLSCGQIICLKQGLGPCTFCSSPLLSSSQISDMLEELRAERGREKQSLNNRGQQRAGISSTPRPFQPSSSADKGGGGGGRVGGEGAESLTAALTHKNTLLTYQSQNARRTTVRDEAADYDPQVSSWASPAERARQLKAQQRILREREVAGRPEWEKRGQVLNISFGKGGKVMKTVGKREKEREDVDVEVRDEQADGGQEGRDDRKEGEAQGGFGRNPLLGAGMIRPTYTPKGKGKEGDSTTDAAEVGEGMKRKGGWKRRVQDDMDDNEAVILDGGVYGGAGGTEERAYG